MKDKITTIVITSLIWLLVATTFFGWQLWNSYIDMVFVEGRKQGQSEVFDKLKSLPENEVKAIEVDQDRFSIIKNPHETDTNN